MDLPDDLARVRDTYARAKLATAEFAEACYAAQQNGRTQREIAEAAGCSHTTVGHVTRALGKSLSSGEPFEVAYAATANKSRKPRKPQATPETPRPQATPTKVEIGDEDLSNEEHLARLMPALQGFFVAMAQRSSDKQRTEAQLIEAVRKAFGGDASESDGKPLPGEVVEAIKTLERATPRQLRTAFRSIYPELDSVSYLLEALYAAWE
jgi:hypothetical protein